MSRPTPPSGSDAGRADRGSPSAKPSVSHQADETRRPVERPTPVEKGTISKGPGEKQKNHDLQERRPDTGSQPGPGAGNDRRPDTGSQPGPGAGNDRRPDTGSRPAPGVGNDRRPNTGSRPSPVVRNDRRPSKPEVKLSDRDIERAREITRVRQINQYRPKWYAPPVRRDGLYYYSARPHYQPMRYAYWVFGGYDPLFCRKSIYFYYGYFPYLEVARVHIGPYVTVSYYSTPVVIDDSYYLSRPTTTELDYALSDIRKAWLDGRSDLITDHVTSGQEIAVLLDGKYDYSLDPDDYVEMTQDALSEIQTVSFTWQTVKHRTDGAYTAYGKHVYRDAEGTTQTVYVSYTLRRVNGSYFIEEVGSSLSPLG